MQDYDGDIAGVEFHDTDYAMIAKAMGADGVTVREPDAFADALSTGVNADVPFVIDARIDRAEDMVASLGSSFYESVGGLHE